jgi:acyl-CoA reductase-like NAD-dependent aldehyde dehydrogenase
VSRLELEPVPELMARVEAALAARERLAVRPLAETIAALTTAAVRWRDDAGLVTTLTATTRLSPAMLRTGIRFAADALDASAMAELVEHTFGAGAARRPPPPGPPLITHVLASNVPALALPAIALACLTGAAVVVKSGRDDPLSAPAFVDALAAVDRELAATVVAAYWPGGDPEREAELLGRADVVVLTGGSTALAELARYARGRLLTYGPRVSAAVVSRRALVDASVPDALALDVALHEQRGCLSPHAVYVERGGSVSPRDFAARLAAALEAIARRLPPAPRDTEERAARRTFLGSAAWDGAVEIMANDAGAVLYDERATFAPTCGGRTVRVHALAAVDRLGDVLPADTVECVGVAGVDPRTLAEALRARGVSRLCAPGRMQRPSLAWPRGQAPPLGVLCGQWFTPQLEIDP